MGKGARTMPATALERRHLTVNLSDSWENTFEADTRGRSRILILTNNCENVVSMLFSHTETAYDRQKQ